MKNEELIDEIFEDIKHRPVGSFKGYNRKSVSETNMAILLEAIRIGVERGYEKGLEDAKR